MVIGAVACVRLADSAEVVVTLRGDKATRAKDLADVTGHERSGWDDRLLSCDDPSFWCCTES